MFFAITSTVAMSGLLGWSYLKQNGNPASDADKIKRIFANAGLSINDRERGRKENIRIHRRKEIEGGMEYVFQMPYGMSLKKIEEHKDIIEEGLNIRTAAITLSDLKKLKFDKTTIQQIRRLFKNQKARKEVELEFDGMLKIRVYEDGLTMNVNWGEEMLGKGWSVPVGQSRTEFIFHDFETMQILVVAGMTRYGKTVFLKNVITTLVHNEPENVKFTLIDLKGGLAFSRFKDITQVHSVARNMGETLEALEGIHSAMLSRQKEFESKGYEDIGEARLQERHFIIVDEGAEIAGFTDKSARERCTYLIGEIARIGAGLGYRMVFATQYPTADVFPRQVKANTSGALCFKLKNGTQSMVVLDRTGAEVLPVGLRGRAIYQTDKEVIVQTPFITNEQIARYIAPQITIKGRNSDESKSLTKTEKDSEYTLEFEEP